MLDICLATLQLSSYWLAAHASFDLPTPPCFTLVLSLMPFAVRYEMNPVLHCGPMYTSTNFECCEGFKSCHLPTNSYL